MSTVRQEVTKKLVVYEDVPFMMFHPNKIPKTIWNGVLSILLIYTATIMPYKMAFIDSKAGDVWFYTDVIVDTLFFCDVCVNLLTAYFDIDGQIITDRRSIF
jgi:hypothetical protein